MVLVGFAECICCCRLIKVVTSNALLTLFLFCCREVDSVADVVSLLSRSSCSCFVYNKIGENATWLPSACFIGVPEPGAHIAGGDSDAWRAVPTLQCLLVRKQVTGGKFLGLVTTEGRFASV